MRNLTCIVCPIGCSLEVEEGTHWMPGTVSPDSLSVNGNRCPRGETYAQEEIRAPKRTVTATCSAASSTCKTDASCNEVSRALAAKLPEHSVRRIPVKTASPCPREMIPALLEDIYKLRVTLPVKAGDILIKGWKPASGSGFLRQDEGINIIATRTVS